MEILVVLVVALGGPFWRPLSAPTSDVSVDAVIYWGEKKKGVPLSLQYYCTV